MLPGDAYLPIGHDLGRSQRAPAVIGNDGLVTFLNPDAPSAASTPVPTERAARPQRPARPQLVLVVDRTEQLTPHLMRVHLGGPDFDAFVEAAGEKLAATDKYVKLLFADPALGLTPPYDLDALRATLAAEQLPVRRTYTVRSVDTDAHTIAIDFVVHGDEGIAGPWAAAAQPGDRVQSSAPGGGYRPSEDADVVHLLLGDDSAIPAIAAALEAMPSDARGTAIIEVGSGADVLPIAAPAGMDVRWIYRSAPDLIAPYGQPLVEAVRALEKPEGDIRVFAHGERGAMKEIRAVVQDAWGLDRRDLSLSAYWALGRAEDAFQAEKREPIGKVFAD
jgi:NADPH-dependent ferric siderophore reductase